jgi:hypothetical protein
MNAAKSDPTISIELIKLIFGNIEQILPLNKKFLEGLNFLSHHSFIHSFLSLSLSKFCLELDITDLEQRVKSWNATSLIGDLFLKYVCIVLFNYFYSVLSFYPL